MNVPFVDLVAQHRALEPELLEAARGVLTRCDFILGDAVQRFERGFAELAGAPHCVGVASGTDALMLALRALDVGPGDEVLAPANTFIATVAAISLVGARPVLVDCDEHHLLDVDALAAALGPRSKVVIPVHLYGQPADMDRISALAAARGVHVLEDSAQAHGATLEDGRRCGSLARLAAFSFYPSKNLGACGDAGAVTTLDEGLARRLRLLRNWGSVVKYEHEVPGYNSRLDTLQAALMNVKLGHLPAWNEARARAAGWYGELLAGVPGVEAPTVAPWTGRHVWHLYVVRIPGLKDRAALLERLKQRGVSAGIHYPHPIHLQKAYAHLGLGAGAFPASERACREIVSLPMFPELTRAQVEHVVSALRAAL